MIATHFALEINQADRLRTQDTGLRAQDLFRIDAANRLRTPSHSNWLARIDQHRHHQHQLFTPQIRHPHHRPG